MLKQEWGYDYLGHLRSPQQPIEVRPPGRLRTCARTFSLPLKGLCSYTLHQVEYEV